MVQFSDPIKYHCICFSKRMYAFGRNMYLFSNIIIIPLVSFNKQLIPQTVDSNTMILYMNSTTVL